MAKNKPPARAVEWVGGIVPAPAALARGDRTMLSLWMEIGGPLLAADVVSPADAVAATLAGLDRARRTPLTGRPHAPARVRVASDLLRLALHPTLPRSTILYVAPTPELEDAAILVDRGQPRAQPTTLLGQGVDQAMLGRAYQAAVALHRARPWHLFAGHGEVLGLRIEALGLEEACLVVLGGHGETPGLALFSSFDAYEAHAAAGEELAAGAMPQLTTHSTLEFHPRADLAPVLGDQIVIEGWAVASEDAFPLFFTLDDVELRNPDARELARLVAAARALTDAASRPDALPAALESDQDLEHRVQLETSEGLIEVVLYRAGGSLAVPFESAAEALEAMVTLQEMETLDPDFADAITQAVLRWFEASPEAHALPRPPEWTDLVLQYASEQLDLTVATLRAQHVRAIVSELAAEEIAESGAVFTELQAFFSFLVREAHWGPARACLSALGAPRAQQPWLRAFP